MVFKSLDAGRITTSPGYCKQNNITRLSHSRKALMMENYRSISEWYDPEKSVVENFAVAQSRGIKVCEKTLRRYCHFNDIKPDPRVHEISEWYNPQLSVKENLSYAVEHNIKASRTGLYEYCKSNGISPKGMAS
ncbi:MAG: hypothetical protein NC453_12180 [Muribaculum sp.]|nr:hypothetical protein [Muribaculum sp.]